MKTEITKEQFLNMLYYSLEDAGILYKALETHLREVQAGLNLQNLSEEKYIETQNQEIANYLYSNFDNIYLTNDEKVIGSLEGVDIDLFDAEDCKAHLDLLPNIDI